MQAAARLMELREEVAALEEKLKKDDIGDEEAAEIGNELGPMCAHPSPLTLLIMSLLPYHLNGSLVDCSIFCFLARMSSV